MTNNEFKNILSIIKRQRKRGFEKYESILTELKDLIADINEELKYLIREKDE